MHGRDGLVLEVLELTALCAIVYGFLLGVGDVLDTPLLLFYFSKVLLFHDTQHLDASTHGLDLVYCLLEHPGSREGAYTAGRLAIEAGRPIHILKILLHYGNIKYHSHTLFIEFRHHLNIPLETFLECPSFSDHLPTPTFLFLNISPCITFNFCITNYLKSVLPSPFAICLYSLSKISACLFTPAFIIRFWSWDYL